MDYVDVAGILHDKTRLTSSELQRKLQGIDVGGDRESAREDMKVALEQPRCRLGTGVEDGW